jgi:uncharacterized protein (TIGR04255 family)
VVASEIHFDNPPLVETVYSLQFEPLESLHLGYIGLAWGHYMSRYPQVSYAHLVDHVIERFGSIAPVRTRKIRFNDKPVVPRLLMTNEHGDYLVQIQNDKFIYNWRRTDDPSSKYPRYTALKAKFEVEHRVFEKFVQDNDLGRITYDQVEVTNVNHIHLDGLTFKDVIRGLDCTSPSLGSVESETFGFESQSVIKSGDVAIGRLYAQIHKTNLASDGSDIISVSFVARATPLKDSSLGSALETMDLLRDHINTAFIGFTTETMHRKWGRQ